MSRTGPASFAHERLYFVDKLHPGHAGYVVALAVRLHGELDAGRLRLAVRDLVARHEALRTTFHMHDGALRQRVGGAAAPEVRHLSRSWEEGPARDAYLRDVVRDGARRPFSLTEGPLLRATIVSWSKREHGLALLVHHIACDGWSVGILLRDLAALYQARIDRAGAPELVWPGLRGSQAHSSPPAGLEPAPSYLDYAVAQRAEWAGGDDGGLAYWRETLSGAPPLTLPADRPRPDVLSDRGAVLRRPLGSALAAALTTWSRAYGGTLFTTALAAYVTVLSSYAGQEEVVVGVPVANRLDEDQEALVGCLVNTLPLRIDASGAPPFTRLVQRVREAALSAFAYQHVPFEQIVAAVDAERQLSHAPLFQTSFSLQNFPFRWPEFAGLTLTEVDVEIDAAKFDLGLSVDTSADEPFVRAEYSTDLFDPDTVAALVEDYIGILRAVAVTPPGSEPVLAVRRRTRKATAPPSTAAAAPTAAVVDLARDGALQERIRLIWAEVLDRPEVGPADNFFDVGGNSLRMVALQQAMSRAGYEMALVDLFRCGTVAACARHLTATPAGTEPVARRAAGREEALRRLADRRRVGAGGSRG